MLIHENIIHKLDYFIENKKIPNIIFYGKDGAGKKYLLYVKYIIIMLNILKIM